MEVILIKDVPRLGQAGEVYDVAAGYARNYLVPQGLATIATPAALNELAQRREAEARQQEQVEEEARYLAGTLEGFHLIIEAKTGEKERLYGSVTSGDIAEVLEKETGTAVDRRKIELEEPIRQLGIYTIPVRLASDIAPLIRVEVVGSEGSTKDKDLSEDERD
jgi:large subunit ribosomal protein L9